MTTSSSSRASTSRAAARASAIKRAWAACSPATGSIQGRSALEATSAGWASSLSVDQRIANAIGDDTAFKSVELGVQVGVADNMGRMCYAGSNRPLPPEDNPYRAFARVFAAADDAIPPSWPESAPTG